MDNLHDTLKMSGLGPLARHIIEEELANPTTTRESEMPDSGWTRHMDSEADAVYEKFGTCLICGEEIKEDGDEDSHEVSNGPGEPIIGAVHESCLDDDDPYASAEPEYHIDLYPDVATNEIGEAR